MPENKHLKFLLIVVYIIIGYYLVTKIMPNIFVIFLPFILAMIVAVITRPLVRLLKKAKLPNFLASILSLIIVLSTVSGLVYAIVYRLIVEITELSKQLPAFVAELPNAIEGFIDRWQTFNEALSPNISNFINDFVNSLSKTLMSLVTPATHKILNIATEVATSLPYILIFTVAFLFSCLFFTKDFDYLVENISRQFPKSILSRITQVKSYAFTAFGKYLRGMAIIMCITFTELLTGFLILKVKYAFLLALIIAFLDALPAVGTGIILIPWGVLEIFNGEIKTGISILVIYLIIFVVRQFIEPKIMSSSFGTYPVLTLIGMYAGLQLFGVVGLIVLPILLTILVYMQRAGLFKLWKTKSDEIA